MCKRAECQTTLKYVGNYCVLYIYVYSHYSIYSSRSYQKPILHLPHFFFSPSFSISFLKKELRKSAAIVNIYYKLCKKVHRNILLVNDFLATSFFIYILCSISLLKSNCFTLWGEMKQTTLYTIQFIFTVKWNGVCTHCIILPAEWWKKVLFKNQILLWNC